ncbi:MAG: acnA, partial [Verrucomicrobia bacterium]|nr:acnA [Verrucomicrobiota bacterium]
AGSVLTDLRRQPLGHTAAGDGVYLEQVWPTDGEIRELMEIVVTPAAFRARADGIFSGSAQWRKLSGADGVTFAWDDGSTYLRPLPYFDNFADEPDGARDILDARALLVLGDSITTDHISPAGTIPRESLAGSYLSERHVPVSEFNQYSTRRGNHEVMLRGIFTNPRLHNELAGPVALGGVTKLPSGELLSVYEAANRHRAAGVPMVIVAGQDYGAGSSRDWAAKGPALLGVRAVIAESFERIHRSNLIGMGVFPLQFAAGESRRSLRLDGTESIDLTGLEGRLRPRQEITLVVRREGAEKNRLTLLLRAETELEIDYLRHGGLLKYLLRTLPAGQSTSTTSVTAKPTP